MENKKLKSQIDYCEACIMAATTMDAREMYKSILESLKQLQTITRNTYFYLTDSEQDAARKFYELNVKGRASFGTIGGCMTYKITPTGLGKCVSICTQDDTGCIIQQDITDVSSW